MGTMTTTSTRGYDVVSDVMSRHDYLLLLVVGHDDDDVQVVATTGTTTYALPTCLHPHTRGVWLLPSYGGYPVDARHDGVCVHTCGTEYWRWRRRRRRCLHADVVAVHTLPSTG